jgi:hypothetical protein
LDITVNPLNVKQRDVCVGVHGRNVNVGVGFSQELQVDEQVLFVHGQFGAQFLNESTVVVFRGVLGQHFRESNILDFVLVFVHLLEKEVGVERFQLETQFIEDPQLLLESNAVDEIGEAYFVQNVHVQWERHCPWKVFQDVNDVFVPHQRNDGSVGIVDGCGGRGWVVENSFHNVFGLFVAVHAKNGFYIPSIMVGFQNVELIHVIQIRDFICTGNV